MDNYNLLLKELEEAVERKAPEWQIDVIEAELFRIEWEEQAEVEAMYSRELAAIDFMDEQVGYRYE
mgnify:CR=1 FL=1